MHPSRRQFLQATAAGVAGLLPLGATRAVTARANASGTTATRASDLLNTLGVCSSITGRGETLRGTIDALQYTGIRWIRCGLEDRISVKDMIDLHKQTGAKIAYGLLSGGTDLARLLDEARQLASAGALLAIEGNNEPNNWGITLHDNQTWLSASPGSDCPVDGLHKNYGRTWRHRFAGYSETELLTLPRVTTETGCPVGRDVTEEIQARLFLNLYLSQFKRGWSHTAIYLLRTRSNEPAHHIYAMYKIDYTAKQAARYLHQLTTILADSESARTLGRIDYSILNQPATVHDLLLQKSDDTFSLVLWGERFAGGSDRITVNLGASYATVNVYDPTVGTSPRQTLTDTPSVTLTLTNHPVVLEIKG